VLIWLRRPNFSRGGGQGGGSPEKRGREVYGRREKRAGSGILKVGGSGRKREVCATVHNILQSKKRKEAVANKNRAGTGIKGYGKREV